MKMTIKKMILDHFKGVSHAEYEFGETDNAVTGRNASGKTTMADAFYWLIADRDYSLNSKPNVRPDNMGESEPSVELVCEVEVDEI